jgi:REP-associated tyrosine transposase
MDLPVRKKLPHAIPQWVADGSWFFITINCVPPGKNQLCRADTGDAVLAAMKFNHERFMWHCRLCLLMPDHVHAIIAFPREPGMATTVKNWKKFVAGKHGVDWQRDFFDHRLRDHHELEKKTSYILMNPVRKRCASEPRIGCGFIVRTTARRRIGRAGSHLHIVGRVTPVRAVLCDCIATARRRLRALPLLFPSAVRLLSRASSLP